MKKFVMKGEIRFHENEGGHASPTLLFDWTCATEEMMNYTFDLLKKENPRYEMKYGNMLDIPGEWELTFRRIK